MAILYLIVVAADDRARGQVEHGHGVAHRVYSLRRTRFVPYLLGRPQSSAGEVRRLLSAWLALICSWTDTLTDWKPERNRQQLANHMQASPTIA